MSIACCVPFCDSNNSTSNKYISIFSFPIDPARKQLWLSKIRRKNIPPKRLGVCIKHFEERFILREQPCNDGEYSGVVVSKKNLCLTKDAYPTILSFGATSKSVANQETSDSEDKKLKNEENSECWLNEEDQINSIDDFKLHYQNKLPSNWLTLPSDSDIYIAKVSFEHIPELIVSIKINYDLTFNVWYKNSPVQSEEFQWLFGKKLKLKSWIKFESLIQHLNGIDCSSLDLQMKGVMNALDYCAKECTDKKVQKKLLSVADHVKFLSFLEPRIHENDIGVESSPKARKTVTRDM